MGQEMSLQPPKSHALHALVIQLGAAEEGKLPSNLGRAIHAQVLDWFKLGNSEVAEAIHHNQKSPLSLSGLLGRQRKTGIKVGDGFCFRISLLDGSLIDPLLSGLEQWGSEPLCLGKFPFVIRSIDTLPGTHRWVGSSEYSIIAKTPKASDDLTLNFLSPTSFKLKEGQGIQPFPLPEAVFGSLQRRWNAFAPEELQLPAINWRGLVSAYELKTKTIRMESGIEIGAEGWVRYLFPDPEQARIATILAHFAFFAGVGRKTAMGMGQTRLDQTLS